MRDLFLQMCTALGIRFEYAKQDFQNLHELLNNGDTCIFLDPPNITPRFTETDVKVANIYTGSFMLLRYSHIEELYDSQEVGTGRYQRYLSPLATFLDGDIYNYLVTCGMGLLVSWNYDEIVNVFDANMDGYIVNYTITEDLF